MKMVALDFLGVGGHGGDTNVLVITYNFSKYAVAVPTNNQKTWMTPKAFFHTFAIYYGFLARIHNYQGHNF